MAKLVHWEIIGPDGAAMKSFYGDLFGWEFETMDDFPEYHMVTGDAVGTGGAVGKGSEEMPSYLTMYFEVGDINATLEQAGKAGGETIMPRTEIPGIVITAMFRDPAGNVVGLVEAGYPEA